MGLTTRLPRLTSGGRGTFSCFRSAQVKMFLQDGPEKISAESKFEDKDGRMRRNECPGQS